MTTATPAAPFVGAFDYASEGQTLEARVGPFRLVATLWNDDDSSPPWERDCGHGPVSDWRPDHSKRPGERELNHDHGSSRFYDFAEAVKIAKRDGWRAPEDRAAKASGAVAARAAEHDFKVLQAWCDDEWRYFGVAVRVFLIDGEGDDTPLTAEYENALWGVEGDYPGSDNSYLVEVANQLAPEALDAARAALAKLANVSAAAVALVEAQA